MNEKQRSKIHIVFLIASMILLMLAVPITIVYPVGGFVCICSAMFVYILVMVTEEKGASGPEYGGMI